MSSNIRCGVAATSAERLTCRMRIMVASRYNAAWQMTAEQGKALIAENRKARHEYFIEDRYEAGLVLAGWEVKSLRAGRAQLAEAYVFVKNGEVFLTGAHLSPLNSASTHVTAEPTRTRKLLLNRSEIDRLVGAVERAGYTLVPLELFWKNGRAKIAHRPCQGQEAARQARHRKGTRLGARQGARAARALVAARPSRHGNDHFAHSLPRAVDTHGHGLQSQLPFLP